MVRPNTNPNSWPIITTTLTQQCWLNGEGVGLKARCEISPCRRFDPRAGKSWVVSPFLITFPTGRPGVCLMWLSVLGGIGAFPLSLCGSTLKIVKSPNIPCPQVSHHSATVDRTCTGNWQRHWNMCAMAKALKIICTRKVQSFLDKRKEQPKPEKRRDDIVA